MNRINRGKRQNRKKDASIKQYHEERRLLVEELHKSLGAYMQHELPQLLINLIVDYAKHLQIGLECLPLALETVWGTGKVPVVMDLSGRANTFFRYRHTSCIDMKNILLRSINSGEGISEQKRLKLMEEMRTDLVAAMKHGRTLVVMMGDTAPDLLKTFSHPKFFPTQLIFQEQELRKEENWKAVVRDEDMIVEGASDNVRWFAVHEDFRVVVTMQHPKSEYGKALQHCVPWEFCSLVEVLHEEEPVMIVECEDTPGEYNGLPDFSSIYA
eukprot:CAMPEP_0184495074 /NCGR_PEP_ID=MMETSP0113_2-20130426/30325_1 /TAXON_ID=91329 /ORGANISM="Norrisiella sphaerica, Strain BC52" /LENGTH=269 /DNA_ID=CAMNT_0026881105 /DNA_START=14 /DNA_END=823 /DNA_ORIENTATION=+